MIILSSLFYIQNIIYLLSIYFFFFNSSETKKSECDIIAIINTALIFDIIE